MTTLKDWADAALAHGRVYYVTEFISRTGMSAGYNLWTLMPRSSEVGIGNDLPSREWSLAIAWCRAERTEGQSYAKDESNDEKLRKRLGFRISKSRRCFVRGGCGYNRVLDILLDIMRETYPELTSNEVQERITLESLNRD